MKTNSLGNRIMALALSIIMVLGMIPTNAIAVESTAVAKIGDTTYETLADAIAAVPTGTNQLAPSEATTVTLLRDTAYAFDVGISTGATTMNLKLDLNGKTLTLAPSVGSVDTKTNGIRVLAYSELEIANGTVVCSSEAADNVKVGIANYGKLTLDNVALKAGDLTIYTVNNRGALTLKGNTSITKGNVCAVTNDPYDLYYTTNVDASLTCDSSDVSVESVLVERYARTSANQGGVKLNISAGYFGKIVEDGASAVAADYTVTGGTIGVSTSEELDFALNMVNAGAEYTCPNQPVTIKLLNDMAGSFDVGISTGKAPKNILLDLNGKTLTLKPGIGSFNTKTNGIRVLAYSKLAIVNGKIVCSSEAADNVKVGIANYSELILDGVELLAGAQTVYTINNRGALTLKGATKVTEGDASVCAITNDPYDLYYTTNVDASLTCDSKDVSVDSVLLERYERNSANKGGIKVNITAGYFGSVLEDDADSVDIAYNIKGGSFGFDMSDFVPDSFVCVEDENGNFVVKSEQTNFGFAADTYTVNFGTNGNKFTATVANAAGNVTYSVVSGNDVATINAQTGELTILKPGTVQVKAVSAGNAQYIGAEDTYTLVINPVYAEVQTYTGGTVTGDGTGNVTVLITDVELNWSPADDELGRTKGWWVGIKVNAPSLAASMLQNAKYQSKSNPNINWADVTEVKSFWSNKDSADTDASHNIQLWFPVSPASLEKFKSENRNITMVYRFDWDGQGEYEQEITFSVDPTGNIVLNKVNQTGFKFTFETTDDTWVGDGTFSNPAIGGQGDGAITYEVVSGKATVDASGKLTFTEPGVVKVKATKAADSEGYYKEAVAEYTITIYKKAQFPKFEKATPGAITYEPNKIFDNPVVSENGQALFGDITYSVSDTSVATIDPATGKLTILKAGTVTVKAVISGNENYEPAEKEYTLVINKAEQPIAFESVAENTIMTYQPGAMDLPTITGKLSTEDIVYTVTVGVNDVAKIENGKLQLLKAGYFEMTIAVPADDCYNASNTLTWKVTVEKADQTGFAFTEPSAVVTYNDNQNQYTVGTTGGQSKGSVTYQVIEGDAASIEETTGVLSILKAGTVKVLATKAGDDCYEPTTAEFVLTVNLSKHDISYEKANVPLTYGQKEYEQALTVGTLSGANAAVTYAYSGDTNIVANFDPATGKITFADGQVGTITVTATKAADDCYDVTTASYTVTVSWLQATALPTVEDIWHTGDVTVSAPSGYQISKDGDLSATWSANVNFTLQDGHDNSVTVYLRNEKGITDAITLSGIKVDKTTPENLNIIYTHPTWEVILKNITFGLYQAEELQVTVSAKDATSGIAELSYNIGNGEVKVPVAGTASASCSFTIDAQHRNDITLTVTDVAGNTQVKKNGLVVVLDTENPDITAEYTYASGNDREYNGVLYTKGDTTVTFTIDESNFDLSGLAIENSSQKTAVPVVKVNGDERTVTWTKVGNTTTWQGSLTLSGDGDYLVAVDYTDPANNPMQHYEQEVRIDSAKPVISVSYDNNTAQNDSYYGANRTATVQITEHNFEPAEVVLTVIAKDITGADVDISAKDYAAYAKNPANWSHVGDVWTLNTAGMKFDIDAIYNVKLEYTDLAENVADLYTTDFIIDQTESTGVAIEYSTSVVDKILNNITFGFYKGNVQVTVSAKDQTAGVEYFQITYTQVDGANNSNKATYTTETLAAVQDATDKTLFTATHTIEAEARGKVSVKLIDKAGNETGTVHEYVVVADTIAPGVGVEYTFTGNQKRAYDNIYYTQGETKVKFSIIEANFDLSLMKATGPAGEEESVAPAPVFTVNGDEKTLVWTQIAGTNEWEAEYTLSGNGDYELKLTYADRSTNLMEPYTQKVHIDNVAPVFDVTYDNNDARNTNQYKDPRTATIKVTEHNFEPKEVVLTVTAKDITSAAVDISAKDYAGYAKNPDNWKYKNASGAYVDGVDDAVNADEHYLVLPTFNIDAIYHVELAYTDLAENVADLYTTDFIIDQTESTGVAIEYSDSVVDKILNSVTFGFYKGNVQVTVSAKDQTAGVEYFEITYTQVDGENTSNKTTYTTETLAAVQDANDKTLFTATHTIEAQARGKVSVKLLDKAGNEIGEAQEYVVVADTIAPTREVIYTPYKILDAATMLDVKSYAEKDNAILYYQKEAVVTFKVTEANFDLSLEETATKPIIKVNGTTVAVEWTKEPGTNTWTATHTITGDGDYVVTMSYLDLSTNEMEYYESCKIAIDGTVPEIDVKYENGTPTQTIEGTKYYKTTQTATVQIKDHNFRADEVVLTVTAKDVQGNPVDISAKAYADYAKNRENWVSNDDVHTLKTEGMVFDIDAIYTFDIVYDDICDNFAKDYAQDDFVVDHVAPEGLKITYSTPVIEKVIETLTFGFYQPSVTVTLTADDATAGVDFFDWTYTKQLGTSDKNAADNGGKITTSDITYTNDGKTATATFTIPANARGYVTATVTDRAGNSDQKIDDTIINVVDNIAPTISVTYEADSAATKVQFVDDKKLTVDRFEKATNALYNGNVTAKIVIDEANFFEGVTAADGVIHQVGIKLTKTDDDGNKTVIEYLPAGAKQMFADAKAEYITWTTKGDAHSVVIPYADNADYVLEITYTDLSTNNAGITANDGQTATKSYVSKVVTVDKIAPVINVTYGNSEASNTIGGRKYFDKVQSAVITVTEHNFRAADMAAVVTAKNVIGNDVKVADFAAQLADEKNWKHDGNVHTAEVKYIVDANYTFDIDYLDLAKNASADYQQDLFTVDTTAPSNLDVKYSTSVFEQIKESLSFGYYNAMMTVTITAEDETSGIYHFAYSYIKGQDVSGVNAELLDQAIKEAAITYNGKKATATFNIPKMVLGNDNQFNGTVEFTAFDRSEVSTKLDDSKIIVVDNISPTSTITYNAPVQTANGISYYAGNINATITINEANFDAKDVVVTVTRDGAAYPVNVSWKDENVDTHIGTFTLTSDGDYIVSVQYQDKSGNKMTSYTSNELTLDATAPTIKVSNIKANSANKDEKYGFVITINDTNLDASTLKPVLKAVVEKDGDIYLTETIDLGAPKTVVSGQTYTYTVEDLPADGLYTLTCEVKDMSANGMSQIVLEDGESYEQVQFSINRNGSAFGYGNKFTEDLTGQYYIYSVDEDVVIVEVNVDPIEKYEVTLNGETLVEGTDYTTTQTSKNGEWSKRTYTINKSLFTAEGEYNIIVSSTDKADTTAFSDVKNLTMAFVVDQTAPDLIITGLKAGGRYQTEKQTVTLNPSDEGGRLNSLMVLVLDSDGNPLKDKKTGKDISVLFNKSGEELLQYLEENGGMATFEIPQGLNSQVKIICNDCAVNAEGRTNEYNELFQKVTVSPNQFVIFYANTPLFVGSIAGVLAVTGLIIFLIKRKGGKKKPTAK